MRYHNMIFLQLSWMFIASVVCSSAQLDQDRFGRSDTLHAVDHAGVPPHFKDACVCLGYNPDTQGDSAACLNVILYDAEQLLSHGHAELIHHLYNAQMLLDEYLHTNECQSNPCVHGTCTDEIDGFSCTCDPGWEGATCNINTNECQSNPCVHGTCTDEIDGFICTCDPGWEGATCNINIDECALNPCVGHATCTDGLMGWECTCDEPYFGSECERAVADVCADYHPFKGITGLNNRTFRGISSVDQCWFLCLKETRFLCNSAEFIFTGNNRGLCNLSVATSYTNPRKFKDYFKTQLKERCA